MQDFIIDEHNEALRVYDKILDIDVTNPEAWNLKGLVHYEQKNYSKALDSVEKAIESDPTYGMAWYNKSCFLSLLNQVPESLEALKRSIEIDVKNARKSIRDKDFANVRIEEGFQTNSRSSSFRISKTRISHIRCNCMDNISR